MCSLVTFLPTLRNCFFITICSPPPIHHGYKSFVRQLAQNVFSVCDCVFWWTKELLLFPWSYDCYLTGLILVLNKFASWSRKNVQLYFFYSIPVGNLSLLILLSYSLSYLQYIPKSWCQKYKHFMFILHEAAPSIPCLLYNFRESHKDPTNFNLLKKVRMSL